MTLRTMKTNLVQSIRQHRVSDLQNEAADLGQHFLHVNLAEAVTRQDVMEMIARQFTLPVHSGKNLDAVFDSLTDPIHKTGVQPGFVVVLEHIPSSPSFDKDIREGLLDVFREIAEYWGVRRTPFRCFYSFAVARTPAPAAESGLAKARARTRAARKAAEQNPTEQIADVSLEALRMSSPFNSGYWLAAEMQAEERAAAAA